MAMALCKILDVPTMMAMITPVASPVAVLKSESSPMVFCAFALLNSKKKMVKSNEESLTLFVSRDMMMASVESYSLRWARSPSESMVVAVQLARSCF